MASDIPDKNRSRSSGDKGKTDPFIQDHSRRGKKEGRIEVRYRAGEAKSHSEEFISTSELVTILVHLREKVGITQKQLAVRMGISQQMVSKMENIDYGGRTFSKIWRHLDALGFRPVIEAVPIDEWRRVRGLAGLKDKQ